MTLQQFITKYNGKKWDFDGSYGAQCVDLFRFYVRDVMESPQPKGVTGAKDFWTAYPTDPNLNKYFDRIENTPTGVPSPGDVMIWGSKYGQYGHIAIVTEADVNAFTALSQNDPIGRETHLKKYNYNSVLGWLHPKKGTMSTLLPYLGVKDETEAKAKLKEHLGEKNGKCNWGETGDRGGHLGSERAKNADLTSLIKVREKEIDFLEDEIKAREKEIARLSNEVDKQGVIIAQLETEIKELKQTIKDLQNAPTEELGALQLITLTFKAISSGKW